MDYIRELLVFQKLLVHDEGENMKFKKNSVYLHYFIFTCVICWLTLLFLLVFYSIDVFDIIWFIFGPGIMLICLEIVSKGGLFCDTVYCNEHGIRVVTRKKTSDCPWNQIKLLDQINGKGGPIGWTVVTNSQEKIRIMTSSRDFIRYVKKVAPYVKITNPWDVNYGVKL